MIFNRLRLFHKNQMGFTLVEVILAIAISGIITGGITMTIFQVITGNIRTGNHMTAVRQVQNAGYWVSHDAQMAQSVDATGASGFLVLTWTDWANDDHQVVYSLLENNELQRSHSINGVTETSLVAQFIDVTEKDGKPQTRCEFTNGVLTFTVTASIGTGSQEQSETRIYEVAPRPD